MPKQVLTLAFTEQPAFSAKRCAEADAVVLPERTVLVSRWFREQCDLNFGLYFFRCQFTLWPLLLSAVRTKSWSQQHVRRWLELALWRSLYPMHVIWPTKLCMTAWVILCMCTKLCKSVQPWERVSKIRYVKKTFTEFTLFADRSKQAMWQKKTPIVNDQPGSAGKEDAQRSHLGFKGAQH